MATVGWLHGHPGVRAAVTALVEDGLACSGSGGSEAASKGALDILDEQVMDPLSPLQGARPPLGGQSAAF
jgi:hypothetical protein